MRTQLEVFFLPQLSQGVKLTFISLSLGCELSSGTRAQGGAAQSVDGLPLLWQRLEKNRRPQAAQAQCAARGLCAPDSGPRSTSWASLTAQVGKASDKVFILSFIPYMLRFLRHLTLVPAASLASVCVGGCPLSVCADSAILPLCTYRKNRQTHMHPEHWLCCQVV